MGTCLGHSGIETETFLVWKWFLSDSLFKLTKNCDPQFSYFFHWIFLKATRKHFLRISFRGQTETFGKKRMHKKWSILQKCFSTHVVAHAHAVLKTVHTLFLEGYLMNLSLKTFQQLLLSFGSVEIYAYGQSGVRFISFQINLGFNLSVHKFWLFQIKPFATAMLKLDWETNWHGRQFLFALIWIYINIFAQSCWYFGRSNTAVRTPKVTQLLVNHIIFLPFVLLIHKISY